jgi:Tfp pilus assembly protein PilZ
MAYQEAVQGEEKRKHPRKSCLISVEFSIKDSIFTNYIYNISNDGVFIETTEPFEEGQCISLKILAPYNLTKANRIIGEVVRVESNGIAIRFKKESPEQEEMIRLMVENI